ncbi:hypothetical protein [Shinella zoogloeoides]
MDNPTTELNWNLTKAVVWIATRDPNCVARHGDTPLPLLLVPDSSGRDEDRNASEAVPHAGNQLWAALDEGKITATGRSRRDNPGELLKIPTDAWSRLRVRNTELEDYEHSAEDTVLWTGGPGMEFFDVGFRVRDVLNLWPPNEAIERTLADASEDVFERRALIEAMETGRTSPHQEVFIKEAREDGTIFWGSSPPWPRDTPDYLFLGRAVNLIGRGRFPEEWHENELSELFLPMFFEGKEHVIKENSYEEMYLSCVVEAVEKDHGVRLEPLDAYFRFIAEDRRKSRDRIWTVYDILVKAFVEGDLKSYGQKIGGGTPFEEIPAIEWTRDDITDWFMFCHQGPYAHSPSRLKRTLPSDKLPKFIFVERASLQAFLQEWGHGLAFFPYAERLPILDTFVGHQPTDDQTIITEPDEAVVSEINGIRFTATERDIHNAVEAIWKGEPMPKAKMQFQAAVNKYLKDQLRYAKSPDPRTYQRYFKKLGATLADK